MMRVRGIYGSRWKWGHRFKYIARTGRALSLWSRDVSKIGKELARLDWRNENRALGW